jgi:dolichyl-phosphate beta-glucosyltransferase
MIKRENVPDGEIQLSIVLPCYRAGTVLSKKLPLLLNYLRKLVSAFEVIVVDDGSEDGGETARIAQAQDCRFISLPRNTGKGAAVRKGMLAAQGRYRIYTDADIPFELSAFDAMLHYLDFKEFHIVAGDRTLPESIYSAKVSIGRRLASDVCSFIVGRFVAGGWYDTQCGLKGFQGAVAQDLFGVTRIERFAFDVELLYVALKRNYDIKRLPVRLVCNDTSSVRLFRDGMLFVRDLARIRWNQLWGRYNRARSTQRVPDLP